MVEPVRGDGLHGAVHADGVPEVEMKIKTSITAALLACALSASAQTAKVIALTPAEAQKAKALHDALLAAQKDNEDYREQLTKKYLTSTKNDSGGAVHFFKDSPRGQFVLDGWGFGFEYSTDFRFIVPVTATFNTGGPDRGVIHFPAQMLLSGPITPDQ